MEYKKDEIEHILYLYPSALRKCVDVEETLHYSTDIKVKNEEEYQFSLLLVQMVQGWLNNLYQDEIEIIDYRYFKKYNYDQISIKLNYSTHSGVIYKAKNVIKKIERRSFDD